MLSTEVYYRNRRWWFAVIEVGRLGQTLERLFCRRCTSRKDAYSQAAQALEHMTAQRSEERSRHNAA